MPNSTSFRLTRPARPGPVDWSADAAQQRVIDHDRGVLRVLAGPGTGKTRTLIEAAAARVERGVSPANLLLLTFSRRAAGQLRDQLTARLQRTIAEPVARTFHSYAFGLVRRAAVLNGDPVPRLLSGSEQDVTLRELLAGRLADSSDVWPAELAAAVRTVAFSDELRELLMRAVERDISPRELATMGRQHDRPDWVVAARVFTEYQQVTSLKAPGAFDAAELIRRAVAELQDNPQLLQAERLQRRRIFVDEYQDTDPAQLELLKLVADGADELVLFGDPDQAIYSFRGAEQNAMAEIDNHFGLLGDLGVRAEPPGGQLELSAPIETVALSVSRRLGPQLLAASRRVAGRLTGPPQHRELRAADDVPAGQVAVAVFGSASHEAARIAATLRRAHAERGVPWSQMAVLVRGVGPATDTLRRGLASAGVPVGQPVQGALADEPVVALLLDLLRCVTDPDTVTPALAESLLLSQVGRADPLQVLRMRRQLRRAADGPLTLADLITDPAALTWLPESVRGPALAIHDVVRAGQSAMAADGAAAEDVLWAVWQASGLAARLNRRSLDPTAGGDASRADRALDAVLALFAEATKVSDRSPGGSARQLREWIDQLQITDAETARRRQAVDEVAILTAHASKGLQWRVVCVAGVQDGSWPNLRRQGSLLGTDLLVDLHAHRPPVSSGNLAERLVEERRLFYVAITRATEQLLVTAVANEDTQPSRFLDELDPRPDAAPERELDLDTRRFELPGLVAELRAALTDEEGTTPELRRAAARQLARLAEAGVPGADPRRWWGLQPLSTTRPIRDPARGPVPIRPSKFEAYTDCQLRALLSELGATDATDQSAAALGTLIHRVAEQAPSDADHATLLRLLDEGWSMLDFGAPWHAENERGRAEAMLSELAGWLHASRAELSLIATEAPFTVTIGDARLSGTVDRLERDADGRLVVIDYKTGKSRYPDKDLSEHPQLAAYQVAVTEGGFTEGRPAESGGAQLIQLGRPNGRSGVSQRQAPLSEHTDPDWVHVQLDRIAQALRGNTVTASPGKSCERCLVRLSCPVQDDGRQVTQ